MRIITALPSATIEVVRASLARRPNVHDRFVHEMVPALWEEARSYNVDPVGVIAHSAKETNFGNFTRPSGAPGNVKPEFRNTAGLKLNDDIRKLFPGITTDDEPLAHATFPTWWIGARAHVQHLLAYVGDEISTDEIVDHRYYLVLGKHNVVHFSDLNGKWAASNPSYGDEVEAIMRQLSGSTEGGA